jgi:hypothetical protein
MLQIRVLHKMLRISCSARKVEKHGGLGENPIWRISPLTGKNKSRDTDLKIMAIERNVRSAPCYDLTTEDHYVYLPESDTVVHNCDDMMILLASLLESCRLETRIVLSGIDRITGSKVRWIEGQARHPTAAFSHIYCAVADRPFNPTKWIFCEPTLKVPLGWDVVNHKGDVLPEMATGSRAVAGLGNAAPLRLPMKSQQLPLPSTNRLIGTRWVLPS